MILATRSGNQEVRRIPPILNPLSGYAPSAYTTYGSDSPAGVRVDLESATGLPAFGRAIRLVAGTMASLSLHVYQGRGADKVEKAGDWRAKLLESPGYGLSVFDWMWDIASSLESCENAYLFKQKDRGKVVGLPVIPHGLVLAEINRDGQKQFTLHTTDGRKTFTDADILHIRGQTLGGGPFGVSRIEQHRDPIGAMLAEQRFEGAYFRNHARPDVAIVFPQGVTKQQAEEWRPVWEAQYGGPDNAGRAIPMGGGATITPIPLSMADAQFIQSRQLGIEDAGRIQDIDSALLGAESRTDVRKTALDVFLRLQLPPRLNRVTSAFRADPDIFGGATDLYPEFQVDDLMFADSLTRAEVQHYQIQDGTLLPDEARAERGQGPLPAIPADPSKTPGMVPQLTPVGGAPNPTSAGADSYQENSFNAEEAGFTVPSIELRVEQNMEPVAREISHLAEATAQTLDHFATAAASLQQRGLEVDERRERRELERAKTQDELSRAHAEAFRAVSQPNITVNVEPTPVTVENTVNVPQTPVQLTMLDEPDAPLDVEFVRHPNGLIKSARITEEES